MDFLKDAIGHEVRKRKELYERAAGSGGDGRRKKYVRVADLESAARRSDAAGDSAAAAVAVAKAAATTSAAAAAGAAQPAPASASANPDGAAASDARGCGDDVAGGSLGADEVVKRLRARGEPVRLFGESDEQRRRRLRQLELTEETTDGQQNEFRRVLAQVEAGAMLDDLRRQARMGDDEAERRRQKHALLAAQDVSDISPELVRTDMERLHSLVYVYLKRLLYEWDDYLAGRPEDERRSPEGKMAAATQRQSAEYLKPLFRSLKQRRLQADVMSRIAEIARHMIDREYMRANDAYLQLSIGNAPWPVGVTQVGIHSRAARENINANKVAHVLNNETQRKWIQSIKRLIRFAQTKYPPTDMAKMA
ncbi:hypothetical protein H4R18_002367 [Coemansia javaensis]|uniref:Pre-mRNA-splicing factor 18 n=1 Tax=Coemansia javaensis TaxID=2761396 RepID=A0A9W8LJ95_9FUNG|nr:hypothetical protein H4R18_002367 [Coemansia javaensis]